MIISEDCHKKMHKNQQAFSSRNRISGNSVYKGDLESLKIILRSTIDIMLQLKLLLVALCGALLIQHSCGKSPAEADADADAGKFEFLG